MNGIIAKVARLAASKAAAFTYAVAVGVAGNIAFNFVEQRHPAPPPSAAAMIEPRPAALAKPEAAAPTHHGSRRGEPATAALPPEKPPAPAPARHPAAEMPDLPEPPALVALPGPDSLPAPALRPAALPAAEPGRPEPPKGAAAPPDPTADITKPEAPLAILPPLGSPIEVAEPPVPPAASTEPLVPGKAAGPARVTPEDSTAASPPADSWQLSDVWHPGRAVAKGLHWAGDQLPAIGDDPPPRHSSASARPIPLFPSAAEPASPDPPGTAPAPSGHPGPGSGGLY